MQSSASRIWTAAAVLIFGAGAALYCTPREHRATTEQSRARLRAGIYCRIEADSGSWVAAAATREIAERWDELSRASDAVGKAQLEEAGLVARVPVGTGCLLIRLGEPACEVRIRSGELDGAALWIARKFLAAQ